MLLNVGFECPTRRPMVPDMIRSDSLPSVTWPDAQYLPSVYGLPEAAEGPGNFSADGAWGGRPHTR
jgi:phospholipase C